MAEIDPSRPPVSADELARDATAAGVSPEAPPLIEAANPPAKERESGAPEEALSDLPPG